MRTIRARIADRICNEIMVRKEKLRRSIENKERQVVGKCIERYHQAIHRTPDFGTVPVLINNRNRLAPMLEMIAFLERCGMTNIIIVDNDSQYPPLLDYYRRTKYRVLRHGANRGPFALWRSPFWREFRNDYYVYTDPDVVPCSDCPADFMRIFYEALRGHPQIDKVGFGLRIDDLPEYVNKAAVIDWEKTHWANPIGGGLYDAPIDTTFALYRPRARGGWWRKALRTGNPYWARHVPWYSHPDAPTEEELFYARSVDRGVTHYTHGQESSPKSWGHERPDSANEHKKTLIRG
jgi:hypothetical protein